MVSLNVVVLIHTFTGVTTKKTVSKSLVRILYSFLIVYGDGLMVCARFDTQIIFFWSSLHSEDGVGSSLTPSSL